MREDQNESRSKRQILEAFRGDEHGEELTGQAEIEATDKERQSIHAGEATDGRDGKKQGQVAKGGNQDPCGSAGFQAQA